jgi:hypothetical protein
LLHPSKLHAPELPIFILLNPQGLLIWNKPLCKADRHNAGLCRQLAWLAGLTIFFKKTLIY